LLQDLGDGHGTADDLFACEGAADIIDGEILFAEGKDPLPKEFLLGRRAWTFLGREEEAAFGVLPEAMDEDAEAGGCIAEAAGGFGSREALDEVGAEGFVEAVRGIGGLEEAGAEVG